MINIKSKGDELLETRLNEVTNPLNPSFNNAAVTSFCDQVLKEPEGHQVAVRLLAHKVQSPQEKEALYAFMVIDECVKNCGSRFHQEVGKFRFLNELIKIISPKYLARSMSQTVKEKCIECLYSLYKGIPHETKIAEAYNMLKKQSIIIKDPIHLDDKIYKVHAEDEQSHSIFDSSKDSERLSRLLKSRNPDDLREANRIIKNIVQEDNQRMQMLSKRASELETMRNNIKLLGEMLTCFNKMETTSDDMDIMKQLIENLEQSRAEMFKLSRETDDNDFINDVIQVIDECNVVIKRYWDVTCSGTASSSTEQSNGTGPRAVAAGDNKEVNLLGDESILSSTTANHTGSHNLLSQELQNLGLNEANQGLLNGSTSAQKPPTASKYDELIEIFNLESASTTTQSSMAPPQSTQTQQAAMQTSAVGQQISYTFRATDLMDSTTTVFANTTQGVACASHSNKTKEVTKTKRQDIKGFEDLDILGQELLNINKKKDDSPILNPRSTDNVDEELLCSLEDKQKQSSQQNNDLPLLNTDLLPDTSQSVKLPTIKSPLPPPTFISSNDKNQEKVKISTTTTEVDLNQISVILSSIQPHPLKMPMTIYHNIDTRLKITIHFASDHPHPDVNVMVAQIASENSHLITDIVLKFAVSKPMKIRKQSSGITSLQPHTLFTPSSPLNEIVLLFNPSKNHADLKFQLSYDINGESYLESGTTGVIGF